MLNGRIERPSEEEEDDPATAAIEILPKWNGIYQMPLSAWRDNNAIYEKSYFQEPIPTLISRSTTQVRIRQDGTQYHYIIQLNGEFSAFLDELERNIYFHSSIYSQQCLKVTIGSCYKKLSINSFVKPTIFDEDKKQISPPLPLSLNAKVKLVASCISRKKGTHSYHVFLYVKLLMLSNECAWPS